MRRLINYKLKLRTGE